MPPGLNSLRILLHLRCGSSPDVLPEAATFVIADAATVATTATTTLPLLLLLLLLLLVLLLLLLLPLLFVFSFGCEQVLLPADCTYTLCGWPESRGFGLGVL